MRADLSLYFRGMLSRRFNGLEEFLGKISGGDAVGVTLPSMAKCGRKPKLAPEQELELVGLSLLGVKHRPLSLQFGVSVTTVMSIIKRHGARKKAARGATTCWATAA